MRLYKNNSGITLIELIISIAIAAIVISMVALMINTAAKSFKHTNEDVNLQMEAQITINQLSTYIMEAKSITKSLEGEGVTGLDVKYKLEYILEGVTSYYVVYFVKERNRLYIISTTDPSTIDRNSVIIREDQYLMAEYVDGITIDYSEGNTAEVEIDFKLGDQLYTASKNIKLRNAK